MAELVSQVLVSVVGVVTMAGGVLADAVVPATARQHMRNPNWSAHAKFHNAQTIWLGVLTGALGLVLTWASTDLFHLAVIVIALAWLSMLGAAVVPGTRWVDPEFDHHRHRRLGPPQLRLAVGLLVALLLAEIVWIGS